MNAYCEHCEVEGQAIKIGENAKTVVYQLICHDQKDVRELDKALPVDVLHFFCVGQQ